MVFMGVQKFIGDVPVFHIIEANLTDDYGVALPFIDPVVKYLTGVLEVLAAILLIFGRRFEGAILSLLIIGGAIFAHFTVLGINTPMSGAPDAQTSPMLFFMAIGAFIVAALVTYIERFRS